MYFVCVDRYKNVVVYKVVNSIAWAVISKQKFGGVGGDNTARKTARKLGDLLLLLPAFTVLNRPRTDWLVSVTRQGWDPLSCISLLFSSNQCSHP